MHVTLLSEIYCIFDNFIKIPRTTRQTDHHNAENVGHADTMVRRKSEATRGGGEGG